MTDPIEGRLYQASGAGRRKHAVRILAASTMWANFANHHAAAFAEANVDKYIVVNAKGEELGRFADPNNRAVQALLRNADGTLRHEDFLIIQDRIVEVRRRELHGIADLQGAGLTFPADISDQLIGFENVSEFGDAQQDMNPNLTTNNDSVYTEDYVPNPITHIGFSVPWRQGAFQYKQSVGMAESVRKVSERLETTLFLGNANIAVTYSSNPFPIYGYTTHPKRGMGTISDWSNPANVNVIVKELNQQLGLMNTTQGGIAANRVMVYVAQNLAQVFEEDYKDFTNRTVYERCRQISQVLDIKPIEVLNDNEVVLVEMLERTVQLGVASDIIMVPHVLTQPMEDQAFTTYAAMVQQIKVDANGRTGIRHLTTA